MAEELNVKAVAFVWTEEAEKTIRALSKIPEFATAAKAVATQMADSPRPITTNDELAGALLVGLFIGELAP